MKIKTTIWGDIEDQDLGGLVMNIGLTRFLFNDSPDARYYTDGKDHVWLNGVEDLGCNPILAAFVDCANTLMMGHPLWVGQTAAAKAARVFRYLPAHPVVPRCRPAGIVPGEVAPDSEPLRQ